MVYSRRDTPPDRGRLWSPNHLRWSRAVLRGRVHVPAGARWREAARLPYLGSFDTDQSVHFFYV